jgi:NADH dehydrogenase
MDDGGKVAVVTGAFSYTGRYVTRVLLERGWRIRTLTHRPDRPNPFGERVEAFPYDFDRPDKLAHTLRGASVFINTYWVRFPRGEATFARAIRNTRVLIGAAVEGRVPRIVHVSIANASADSTLGYYRGKAETEQVVKDSGMSYAILRPTVIFGLEDILINNIAWFLRRFPVFLVPGDGQYGIRPIAVDDMAALVVRSVDGSASSIVNAVGPESFAFDDLVRLIGERIGRPARVVHTPMSLAHVATTMTGWFVGDVVLTWDEYRGLTENLLAVEGPAAGDTRLSDWLTDYRDRVGMRYASELARHYDR